MHIWLTGSKGFIGKHLQQRFVSLYERQPILKKNTICIPHEELYSISFLKSLPAPDVIYHFAAYGNMSEQLDSQEMFRANVLALNNLLESLKDVKFKSFINISSSSVYGEKKQPMNESDLPEATDYYGVTKNMGELLVRAYAYTYDKPVINARLFSVYGEGEAEFRFIPTILRCIKNKEPMKIAPGMHDWIYIDDLIEALFLIKENASDLKGRSINIGTGIQYDNYDVLRKLCRIANVDIQSLPIEHVSSMRSRNSWVADNSFLKNLVWMPQYSLEDGLTKIWNSTL